ncbi:MAG: transcription-repair coupling factor [Bacteroidales bacterium]|nr:transcription-repair coupling factor [Bacteroidales bacterium]
MLNKYQNTALAASLQSALDGSQARVHLTGVTGSLSALLCAALSSGAKRGSHLFIAPNKEEAFYVMNDLESALGESGETSLDNKRVLLFPSTYRRPYETVDNIDNANVLMRSEVVRQLGARRQLVVVTYPEALSEKVVSQRTLAANTLEVRQGDSLTPDFVVDVLLEYGFERVDFVVEPGQYAVRGGIVDLFSFAHDAPTRIEFLDDEVHSLRSFAPDTQLSTASLQQVTILPDLATANDEVVKVDEKVSLLHYFSHDDVVWVQGLMYVSETIESSLAKATTAYMDKKTSPAGCLKTQEPEQLYCGANEFLHHLLECKVVETGSSAFFKNAVKVEVHSEPQPVFNKQFDRLCATLTDYMERGYDCTVCVSNDQQQRRLQKIFSQFGLDGLSQVEANLSHGFVDHDSKLLCFTDHEIFERYHKYTVRDLSQGHQALTLKELFELHPGDYVTHIDYGVGRFSGLEKIETPGGKTQEVIRLLYKNNDTLYISIHGLHKISRYVGKDGAEPQLNRLGSNQWQVLKQRTKSHVKDIAKDLIALYAKRKASRGFAFSADSYLQHELEASFIYEDTPDQYKATLDVKSDMENVAPMDRLVCGDVGFGKTEVAIRAAFKAVADSKQVAVLVPATILALQHYNTFKERLEGLPVRVDYLNRFRSTKDRNRILKEVEEGKIDILIGTHAIAGGKVQFKDLGLLIIDEEQKFGVSAKEKLRQMKVNVDCLTLTATPIPRTLQFSLMGARDLSVIQTPPPNRQPIQTELLTFDEETIRDAISYEMSRNGQTFFISNRVENLDEMASLVQRLVPDAVVATAHGQMEGRQVEETFMRFIDGEIDVLVATSIIENGLDIPNANTMIIVGAQQFGLADLHQMRGRVGRSNKKAFCYMMVPSFSMLTPDALKRLKAIEEFSSIGSGFNIAMRDLDIRGAGNILGAEQSGFISEIGYDMYQKILNEAIEELREGEFRDLFPAETDRPFVRDCTLETDLEVLLPDDYVTNISERLLLYKELGDLESEEELQGYRSRLQDRFGPLPEPTEALVQTVTLRRIAKTFGIEKLLIKEDPETHRERMILFFPSGQNNPFYNSQNFSKVITYAQAHPRRVHLKENNNRLTMTILNVNTVAQAIDLLQSF